MPTVAQNIQAWNDEYHWEDMGDEWSATWGGAEAQWYGSLLPRIHSFLPAPSILEIAPGFGRWTEFLRRRCERLAVVDVAEKCITACRKRFASDTHISYYVNDGRSLEMIADDSVDFVFSFDSLVHVEADVINDYLRQLATKLTENGVGFIHHSNIGAYKHDFARMKRIPNAVRTALGSILKVDPDHGRGFSMTAGVFDRLCLENGLQCISQELVNWGSRRTIDCFSLFTRPGSSWVRPHRVMSNPRFMDEAAMIRQRATLYAMGRRSAPSTG